MFHDRVSFGGSLIAIGSIYIWLAEFPLREREAWAWWLFVVSGLAGFGSFLAYLGYGYLDTWHGIGTLLLIPFFIGGLVKTRVLVNKNIQTLFTPEHETRWRSQLGVGRALLLATAAGMMAGGVTIMTVGMTRVFVPQDLQFIGLTAENIRTISPRLVPLIAHDRAGFGGAICTTGITVFFSVLYGKPSKSLWQVLCFAGLVGFATAIAVHPVVGYVDVTHLAPAVAGALAFVIGIGLCYQPMINSGRSD